MNTQFSYSDLDTILKNHEFNSSNIIAILQDTQDLYKYIPKEAFTYFSEKLGMSMEKMYSLAAFYDNFFLEQKGSYVLKICDGTACHVSKSAPILDILRSELGLSKEKITTDDLMFTVETSSCLSACGLAPVITINDKVYGLMTPEKAIELLNTLKEIIISTVN
ncbi:MAG: NADH-quinone oxidoreductase subunit E [Clostridium sp.]|jgi:NADH-quinone oxidoreductase subunit E